MVTKAEQSFAAAAEELAARDPVLAHLHELAGPPRIPRSRETPFEALLRAIVFQQLATPAARAIHGRLLATLDDDPQPEAVLALSDADLRQVGLSAAKVASVRDLATKALDGTVELDRRSLSRLSDDEIITRLSLVRGIGPWSASVFLIFQLHRRDVWPAGDLGIRRGFGLAWDIPTPTERELKPLGEPYRPYRSVLAWYCWRADRLLRPARAASMPIE